MMRIEKRILNFSKLLRLIVLLVLFISCDDNSDQIVENIQLTQLYKVSDLIEETDLNTSNLKETVIAIQGMVVEINYLNDRQTIILKDKKNDEVSILCDMQQHQKQSLKDLIIGETITVKGILKGSLKDIILLHCIISTTHQKND